MNRPLLVLLLNLCLIMTPSGYAAAGKSDTVRKPMHAGKYYPADKKRLQEVVKTFTSMTQSPNAALSGDGGMLKAVIMSHGNIKETGRINGAVAKILMGKQYDKITLMSPDHHLIYNSSSISAYDFWETPLGRLKVHKDSKSLVQNSPKLFRRIGFSDNVEYSIESVLPFLQYSLQNFSIIPILTGRCDVGKTADALIQIVNVNHVEESGFYEKNLFVVISNLSKNLSHQQAMAWDKKTLGLILRLDSKALTVRKNSACGIQPVLILIDIAKKFKWRPYLLHYSTSENGGNNDRKKAVGYSAVAFYGGPSMIKRAAGTGSNKLSVSQGKLLLRIARRTIAKKLGYKTSEIIIPDEPVFQSGRGTFVTLKIDNKLRGCIGNLSSDISVADGVSRNAVNAAFHDSRFPPLRKDELEKTEIEVSILTEPAPLEYKDANELISKLKPGIDGVIIRKGRAGSTFLPQVWEQLPEPVDFLEHLCLKAGLPRDAWQTSRLEVLTYQAQYFDE